MGSPKPFSMTAAPACARALAMPSPMPLVEPVTIAVRPSSAPRAAEKCNVTQPALSRAIQQLEDEVGGLLFRRERNLTHITDLGALLRPRFQQIVDELSGVRHEASQFLRLDDAQLKVGVMCTI